jgi:hypothetical protein
MFAAEHSVMTSASLCLGALEQERIAICAEEAFKVLYGMNEEHRSSARRERWPAAVPVMNSSFCSPTSSARAACNRIDDAVAHHAWERLHRGLLRLADVALLQVQGERQLRGQRDAAAKLDFDIPMPAPYARANVAGSRALVVSAGPISSQCWLGSARQCAVSRTPCDIRKGRYHPHGAARERAPAAVACIGPRSRIRLARVGRGRGGEVAGSEGPGVGGGPSFGTVAAKRRRSGR